MRSKEIKQGTHTYRNEHFATIGELLQTLKTSPTNAVFTGHTLGSKTTSRPYWYGTANYLEAYKLLTEGWIPEAEKLAKKVPIKTVSSNVSKSRPQYSVVGSQASVPRYLQGIPTNMIDRRPQIQKQKIISLYKSLSYAAFYTTEQIEQEGIKALQIIQLLENKGYRVKLTMFWSVTANYDTATLSVTIKQPDERLALSKMAFPLIHPSMLRRICFNWLETSPSVQNSGFTYGYGRPDTDVFRKFLGKGEYLIPESIADVDQYLKGLDL